MQQTIFGANRTERPIAPAGKVLVEGIGYFDGDDKAVLEKAFFKQKVIMIGLMIAVPLLFTFIFVALYIK